MRRGAHPGIAYLLAALVALLAYLLGSIPSACCSPAPPAWATCARSAPGNIGATNVLRTGNKDSPPPPCCWTPARASAAVVLVRCS
jgi:glycerol-3-phosphate acyltransferase PlsY